MADIAAPACLTCNDAGRVFSCPRWPGCGCPGATTLPRCPGVSAPCPDCAPCSDSRDDIEAEATSLMAAGDIFHHPIVPAEGGKADRPSRDIARAVRSEPAGDSARTE